MDDGYLERVRPAAAAGHGRRGAGVSRAGMTPWRRIDLRPTVLPVASSSFP
jgi:hypothetical protein